MALGQSPGPSATHTQMRDLLGLVVAAGHNDFRDARSSLRLTQRQAGGKFTRDEADALIERLQAGEDGSVDGASTSLDADVPALGTRTKVSQRTLPSTPAPSTTAPAPARRTLSTIAAEVLAAELQRRGWVVLEP